MGKLKIRKREFLDRKAKLTLRINSIWAAHIHPNLVLYIKGMFYFWSVVLSRPWLVKSSYILNIRKVCSNPAKMKKNITVRTIKLQVLFVYDRNPETDHLVSATRFPKLLTFDQKKTTIDAALQWRFFREQGCHIKCSYYLTTGHFRLFYSHQPKKCAL